MRRHLTDMVPEEGREAALASIEHREQETRSQLVDVENLIQQTDARGLAA